MRRALVNNRALECTINLCCLVLFASLFCFVDLDRLVGLLVLFTYIVLLLLAKYTVLLAGLELDLNLINVAVFIVL